MDKLTYDIADFDTEVNKTLDLWRAEKQKLRDEQKKLHDKIDMLINARKCVRNLQKNLDRASDEIDMQKAEIDDLKRQLTEERRKCRELDIKLRELDRLPEGATGSTSEDDLLKALRTYADASKRKTADKRSFAKRAIQEIAHANGRLLPADLAEAVDHLDDEHPDTKVVNNTTNNIHVDGDLALNKHVDNQVDSVATGATGISLNHQ